jgi:excisionase family DNA binding protein
MPQETYSGSHAQGSEQLLAVAEVRSRTQLSDRQIRRMISDGRLAAVRLRGVRAIRVHERALLALVQEH